ncbi:hypothetical protein [Sphingomonas sp.]|nr:hypothetical protein [Sphingomonas sp.]MBX3595723.1 hypothetical protein [Sphingomonas sp.]
MTRTKNRLPTTHSTALAARPPLTFLARRNAADLHAAAIARAAVREVLG